MANELLSPDEFSKRINLGVHLIRKLAKSGAIRCLIVGKHIKIPSSEVEDFTNRIAHTEQPMTFGSPYEKE
jgi:excisionase family DNA binding protein